MIFKNKPLVQKLLDTDIKHRDATTGLDRKSTFYDRNLSQEFKKHFVFIRPGNTVDKYKQEYETDNTNKRYLVKKR